MKIFFSEQKVVLRELSMRRKASGDHTEVESLAEFYSEGVLRKKVLLYSVCALRVYFYTEGADCHWQELPQVSFLSQQ